jgi:ubiquinone/menaquinone biosynthesis C-methylase UbiE
MATRVLQPSDLYTLDKNVIKTYLRDFLCIDSLGSYSDSILADPNFSPDSFTIQEVISDASFLSASEVGGYQFIKSHVISQLDKLQDEGYFVFGDRDSCVDFAFQQIIKLLEYELNGIPLAEQIFNQESPDVIQKVLSYCLYGDPNHELHTHRSFNELGLNIVPVLIERHLLNCGDLKELLKYSIASGLIGLDLKGSNAAASSFSTSGIRLGSILNLDSESIADLIYNELVRISSKSLVIDHWDMFINEILHSGSFKLVWCTDDFIETIFDLYFIQKLLEDVPFINITLIPKNGQHANDASYVDVLRMLHLPIFSHVKSYIELGRFRVTDKGPSMGAVNLRKLSSEVVNEIATSNAVYVKGCRAHEMVQGGLNAVTYTSMVVVRDFTESETGLDARETPLIFFRCDPSEYAYWGFKGRAKRRKILPDGRQFPICHSTLEEHEMRKSTDDPNLLISELNSLTKLHGLIDIRYEQACRNEVSLVVNRLSDITKASYDAGSELYSDLRGQQTSEKDIALIDELLEIARARVRNGKLGDAEKKLFFLEIGAAQGRDLRYVQRFPDVRAIGIDNAPGFIRLMDRLAEVGEISPNTYHEMDMRYLKNFGNATFDIVRHNATLLHLPMLPSRIGADEAIAESYRVLRSFGLLYVLVKEGEGLTYEDTEEGLGYRVFQYYTKESLMELLERNCFKVIDIRKRESKRPSGSFNWIIAFAEKPG